MIYTVHVGYLRQLMRLQYWSYGHCQLQWDGYVFKHISLTTLLAH